LANDAGATGSSPPDEREYYGIGVGTERSSSPVTGYTSNISRTTSYTALGGGGGGSSENERGGGVGKKAPPPPPPPSRATKPKVAPPPPLKRSALSQGNVLQNSSFT